MNRKTPLFQDRRPLALAALLALPAATAMADSMWIGTTGTFNNSASWNPVGVPNGSVNADNDHGLNNVVRINSGDPVWTPWDIRAGNGNNTVGAFLQTGSTNTVGGWFRMGVGTLTRGN